MASTEKACVVSLPAGAALRGHQFDILKLNSSGQVVLTAAAKDIVVGVLWENPASEQGAGDNVAVALISGGGVLKVKAAEAIEAGALLIAHNDDGEAGHVADIGSLATDDTSFGIALEAAASGQIFKFLADRVSGPHTA